MGVGGGVGVGVAAPDIFSLVLKNWLLLTRAPTMMCHDVP